MKGLAVSLIVALLVADACLLEQILASDAEQPQDIAVLDVSDKELEGVFTFDDKTIVVIPERTGDEGH